MQVAAATIVAKSMLAHARVTARSFAEHHDGIPFFALLADELDGAFDPAREPFALVPLDALDLRDPIGLRFAYEQQPLSYATTPHLIAHLLERGFDAVVFVKQESHVLGSLAPVLDPLRAGASLVLTPHLLQPAPAAADELVILLSGVFNGGIVGARDTPETRAFLAWWSDRLHRHCVHDVARGLHYEQRWLDLAPSLVEHTHIVRDPTVNIGHWNLRERAAALPRARLVRFSGYSPDEPGTLTRYFPDRSAAGLAAGAVERFRRALEAEGWAQTSRLPYAFARFDNGVRIPPLARELYRDLGDGAARFGDPFATAGPGSFFAWLNEDPPVTRLWRAVLERRVDLREAFPDPAGADAEAFMRWTCSDGAREYAMPEAFLPLAA